MWQASTISESKGSIIKIAIAQSDLPLRFSEVLKLLGESADFRSYFNALLASVEFAAFRWETPPVTISSSIREFECVAIDSPGLARTPDADAFAEYFTGDADGDITVFPNLGKDAVMLTG